MGAGFPIDLLLFGMIAAFLVLRLRGILGKRTGFERSNPANRPNAAASPDTARVGPTIDGKAETPEAERPLPDPASPTGQTLQAMQGVDRNFSPAHFLSGAEAAFRMIVSAFANGDRVALRPLLGDTTYGTFEQAISARESAGQTQRSEIKGIEQASIDEVTLNGSVAHITVRFVSDQVSETLGADGRPVAGADAVAEITDLWTFERDLSQPDPAWRLEAARTG